MSLTRPLVAAHADRTTPPVRPRTGRSDWRSDVERRRITIFDTTLRDGEQSPGIALQPHEKAEIAEQLERLGVDVIEAGFPASSPGDFEGVREVARTVAGPTVAALARTRARGRRRGGRGGRRRAPLAAPRLHRDERPAHGAQARARARRGRRAGPVRRSATRPDAPTRCSSRPRTRPAPTRTSSRESAARRSPPARRRSTCPTRSATRCPTEHADVPAARSGCAARSSTGVTVSVHCHDDLGLAVANSLAGVEAGAGQVECTVNGIGERAGNAALEEIVMALRVRADASDAETGVVVGEIGRASALVSRLTGYSVQRCKAIVGANAFAHEAGIHQDGVLKDVSTYQIMDPEELGLTMTLPLGKHSGRHAFARACAEAGIELTARRAEPRLRALQGAGRRSPGGHAHRRVRDRGGGSPMRRDVHGGLPGRRRPGAGADGGGVADAPQGRRACTASRSRTCTRRSAARR